MKITVYTTNECQFSKQEKEYLTSLGLAFEEKVIESNREYLSEMLAVSNNFAGTPVTKIEKDDGSVIVLKGFTKEEFEKNLKQVQPAAVVTQPQVNPTNQPTATPPPQAQQAPVQSPAVQATQPPAPVAQGASVTPPAQPDPMESILNNLQQQVAQAVPEQVTPPQPVSQTPQPPPQQ